MKQSAPYDLATKGAVVLYECGICECLHPWDWNGDCRDNANRFTDEEDYIKRVRPDLTTWEIELRTMDERVETDSK